MIDGRIVIVHGSNNSVHILQPATTVAGPEGAYLAPVGSYCLVFGPREHQNYPYFSGSTEDLKYILRQIQDRHIVNKGQGWYVPFSNGLVPIGEVDLELNGNGLNAVVPKLSVGKMSEVQQLLARFSFRPARQS